MKTIYFAGVIANLILIIIVSYKNAIWNDFNACTSKSEKLGMVTAVCIGLLIYSLFSWITFCDIIYNEYLKKLDDKH